MNSVSESLLVDSCKRVFVPAGDTDLGRSSFVYEKVKEILPNKLKDTALVGDCFSVWINSHFVLQ